MNSARTPTPPVARPTACQGTTKLGKPCRMSVTSSGWCIQHDPATTAAERSIWGKRGNLSSLRKRTVKEIQAAVQKAPEAPPLASLVPSDDAPDFATAPTVRGYLEKMAQRVQNNQLAPSQATAIAQLAKLALDLVALQNERDLIDLELEQARDREAATRPPIRILP